MEVGLSPGDSALDGDPAPSPKRGGAPIFDPCLLWPRSPISAADEMSSCFIWHKSHERFYAPADNGHALACSHHLNLGL